MAIDENRRIVVAACKKKILVYQLREGVSLSQTFVKEIILPGISFHVYVNIRSYCLYVVFEFSPLRRIQQRILLSGYRSRPRCKGHL